MKPANIFVIVVTLGLGNVACVQSQRTEAPTQADSSGRKSGGSTDPSESSALPGSASRARLPDTVDSPHGADGNGSRRDTKWVSSLVGMKVETPAGARLGTVKDVVVDGYGRQTYAIISYAGMMGLGSKYPAVPWATR